MCLMKFGPATLQIHVSNIIFTASPLMLLGVCWFDFLFWKSFCLLLQAWLLPPSASLLFPLKDSFRLIDCVSVPMYLIRINTGQGYYQVLSS